MVILMATLFWALWDEDFGQRPWKAFQHEWKDRYSTFLKTARSQSSDSQKDVESSPDYQKLKQDYENASQNAAPRIREINEKLRDLSAGQRSDWHSRNLVSASGSRDCSQRPFASRLIAIGLSLGMSSSGLSTHAGRPSTDVARSLRPTVPRTAWPSR